MEPFTQKPTDNPAPRVFISQFQQAPCPILCRAPPWPCPPSFFLAIIYKQEYLHSRIFSYNNYIGIDNLEMRQFIMSGEFGFSFFLSQEIC